MQEKQVVFVKFQTKGFDFYLHLICKFAEI